jgi:hypothetical protein
VSLFTGSGRQGFVAARVSFQHCRNRPDRTGPGSGPNVGARPLANHARPGDNLRADRRNDTMARRRDDIPEPAICPQIYVDLAG